MTTCDRRQFLRVTAGALALAGIGVPALAQGKIKPGDNDVLVVVDVQNCFVPGGTLPVPEGDKIIPLINRLAPAFTHVVMTQDWHTPGHECCVFDVEGWRFGCAQCISRFTFPNCFRCTPSGRWLACCSRPAPTRRCSGSRPKGTQRGTIIGSASRCRRKLPIPSVAG